MYRIVGFLASVPGFCVSSLEKTLIEAIRHFHVYATSEMVAFSENCRISSRIISYKVSKRGGRGSGVNLRILRSRPI